PRRVCVATTGGRSHHRRGSNRCLSGGERRGNDCRCKKSLRGIRSGFDGAKISYMIYACGILCLVDSSLTLRRDVTLTFQMGVSTLSHEKMLSSIELLGTRAAPIARKEFATVSSH